MLNGQRVRLEPLRIEHADELMPVLNDSMLHTYRWRAGRPRPTTSPLPTPASLELADPSGDAVAVGSGRDHEGAPAAQYTGSAVRPPGCTRLTHHEEQPTERTAAATRFVGVEWARLLLSHDRTSPALASTA